MSRFLRVWGPDLIGVALLTAGGMGDIWCGLGGHWYLMVPSIAMTAVAFFATIADLIIDRPAERAKALDAAPCVSCIAKANHIALITKDRDELREALAVLRLPEDRP